MKKHSFLLLMIITYKIAGSYSCDDTNPISSLEEHYARDIKYFKKTVNSYDDYVDAKQIKEIVDSGYPCACKNELVKCHQLNGYAMSNPIYKSGMLDVVIERKPDIVRKYKRVLFDIIVTDCFSYYCMLRALTPYLNVYEPVDAQYYITSILSASDVARKEWAGTSTEAQKYGLAVRDKYLSTYLSILIENNINTAFLNTQEGKEKLHALNGEYFPNLKKMLENNTPKI